MRYTIVNFFNHIKNNLNWLSNSHKIKAIYDEDLSNIMSDLFELEHVCYSCNTKLDSENLAGWIKIEGSLKPFCNKPACIPK